ncbi:major facilitator superfamily domain-containing protein, partial [Dimargaris cristalligena]
ISNAQFGLMQASLSVVPTIMPFLGGLFVDRFGTGLSSFLAISLIVTGQCLVLIGSYSSLFVWMVLGYVVFGVGEGWLVVISETILVHFFHGRGLAVMIGLQIAIGKCASFLATGTAIQITEWTGYYGNVFVVGFILCISSWIINLAYLGLVRHLNRQVQHQALSRSSLDILKVLKFSDVIWWFFLMCLLFGAVWIPFIHLSSNIVKVEFAVSDARAAWISSVVFGLPMLLNPLMGFALDRWGRLTWFVFASSVCLVLATGLILFPVFSSPLVAMVIFSISLSLGPLAQITAIPLMLPPMSTHRDIGTILGIRRCVEHIGATLVDTLSGVLQDLEVDRRYTYVLQVFFALSCATTFAVLFWAKLDRLLLDNILTETKKVRPHIVGLLKRSYNLYGEDLAHHPALRPTEPAVRSRWGRAMCEWSRVIWVDPRLRKIIYVSITIGLMILTWSVFWFTGLKLFLQPTKPHAV